MRKQLPTTNNQNGFALPFVLFVVTIVFILVTANINSYKLDIKITERHLQQIKIETLFQTAREKVKMEIKKLQLPETVSYNFPDGNVRIEVKVLNQNKYELFFNITTNPNEHIYAITNILQIEENVTE